MPDVDKSSSSSLHCKHRSSSRRSVFPSTIVASVNYELPVALNSAMAGRRFHAGTINAEKYAFIDDDATCRAVGAVLRFEPALIELDFTSEDTSTQLREGTCKIYNIILDFEASTGSVTLSRVVVRRCGK